MKGFFSSSIGTDYKGKKGLLVITTTGMLIGLGLLLRMYMSIQITPDIRISFAFIAVMIAAALYGPIIGGVSAVLIDFLGYILADSKIRDYSLLLASVQILAGVIYGLMLYNKEIKLIRVNLARIIVVLLCDMLLNSAIIYVSYVNKGFDITSFNEIKKMCIWSMPRFVKNLIQLPIDLILVSAVLPAALKARRKAMGY